MPSYLTLGKYTDEGISGLKGLPQRMDAVKQAAQAVGGRLVFFYLLMGEYDFAALLELPDDETAARLIIGAAGRGNFRPLTMKAFTEEESRRLVEGLP